MQTAEYRESLRKTFDEQHKKIESAYKDMSAEQLAWAPDDKTWSIGHCLYHIWLTNDKYLLGVMNLIREGRFKAPDDQDYEPNGAGQRFITKIGPGGSANMMVPKAVKPDKKRVPKSIVQLTLDQLNAFDEFVQESSRIDIMKTKLRSPIMPLVRLQVGDVFKALAEHNERHLRQAERMTLMPGFPGGMRENVSPVG